MYWTFNQEQLERALAAFAESQIAAGTSHAHASCDQHQIRTFLMSKEAVANKLAHPERDRG